jgi:catechol 2,3-dioxygenase-like lactoylglutathione lyase family enzyme
MSSKEIEMSDDPLSSLPVAESAYHALPGDLELGAFSISLNVADLAASEAFYRRLGFEPTGGDGDSWLILVNGEAVIGLFQGMFEGNVITFNPGLTNRMERLESFTDVRDIQSRLDASEVDLAARVADGSGPGHISLVDPDGNSILIDQHF